MKKINYIISAIFFFFIFSMSTYARTIVTTIDTGVRIRDKATTDSNILVTTKKNDTFTLIDLNKGSSGNGCKKDWYKVLYNEKEGYVCSEYVSVTEEKEEPIENKETEEEPVIVYENYSDYLVAEGFPESYFEALEKLHELRPNWTFKVMNIDLDFLTVVNKEHTKDGRSLIEDTNHSIDGLKSLEPWSYTFFTDVFSTNFSGGGSRWYAASKDTIAYYLDPRNFFNEKQIFMFESQYFNKSLHTKEGIEKMLKGTFMEGAYADSEEKKTYADAFYDGATTYNISPYVLVSRVIQEVGSSGSAIVSGKVKGYEGYYNFYNISAYGTTASETIAAGLKKAKAEGWNTPYKAVVGGAKFMVDGYLSQGQDTLYLNKWDLIGPTYYTHQYMQNIEAPSHESIKTYNAYKNIGALDNTFVFSIPVFKNMPESNQLPNKGNPNNYLSSLSVNGAYLFESPVNELEFTLNLATTTTSIEIAASKVSEKATITGTGSIALTNQEEVIPVIVTAENGGIRTYNIKVTRTEDIPLSVSEILNISNIKNDGTYITGINVGSDISELVSKIKEKEERTTISITDINNKEKTSGIVMSGDKINIKTETEEKNYIIIIYGDINADGKITSADYIKVKNHIMETNKLTDLEMKFADANKDGLITSADYVAIKNHIMETKLISQ